MARIKGQKQENLTSELSLNHLETTSDEDESSLASFTRKRGLSGSEPKQSIKLELQESLSKVIHEGLMTLEERGLKRSAADFVQSCLEGITENQVSLWVEKETPLEWRVNQCLKDTEKAKLIRKLFDLDSSKSSQTLKAIEQIFDKKEKGIRLTPPKKKKKPNLPVSSSESVLTHAESQSESSLLSQ